MSGEVLLKVIVPCLTFVLLVPAWMNSAHHVHRTDESFWQWWWPQSRSCVIFLSAFHLTVLSAIVVVEVGCDVFDNFVKDDFRNQESIATNLVDCKTGVFDFLYVYVLLIYLFVFVAFSYSRLPKPKPSVTIPTALFGTFDHD